MPMTITITVRDDIAQEMKDAFAHCYANPDSLTPEDLVKHHTKNYMMGVLNTCREQDAVDTAVASVTPETDIE